MRSILVFALMMGMMSTAMADYRNHRGQQRHHESHRHHNRINPWVAGAIGLGVVGAGTYYYNQRRSCWDAPVVDIYGRQIYDRYGRPLFQSVCE